MRVPAEEMRRIASRRRGSGAESHDDLAARNGAATPSTDDKPVAP
jgi:hypothetical protein